MWTPLIETIAPRGSRLVRTWEPPGQLAARVTGLEIELPGGERMQAIARRHRDAAKEFRLLGSLAATGLPVPRPLGLAGDVVAIDLIDGAPDPAPPAATMADLLARIHRTELDLSWLPASEGPPPRNPPVLLHGDLWPGNVLWRDGRPAAIIDWEDAVWGDPLRDLADSRLEMLWACGADAMRAFTRAYRSLMRLDYATLPDWDLYMARAVAPHMGGWGLQARPLRRMRAQLAWFARQAQARPSGE